MHLKIAILEDSRSDFLSLASVINEWSEKLGYDVTIKHYTDETIISAALSIHYDIIFSDVDLKNTTSFSGIDICTKLRKGGFQNEIIFTTAFKEYVFDGYNVRALNYLMKPISLDVLSRCMQRFLEIHEKKYYTIQDRGNCTLLKLGDILYVEKQGHNILLHTSSLTYSERLTIHAALEKLPAFFIPCHKSFIVNLHHIRSITGNSIQLTNGEFLNISRSHLSSIRKAVMDFTFL